MAARAAAIARAPLAALKANEKKTGRAQILDLDTGRWFICRARVQTRACFRKTRPPEIVVTGRVLARVDQYGPDLGAGFKRQPGLRSLHAARWRARG